MEVELLPDEASEDENYGFDDAGEDYLNFEAEGERCGICTNVVIDRGVIDCCQHWFCFACIDNWASITSLCPLCQNEFQLITCVPVYDTVGGNKTDDDTNPRDDDWFIEGKGNTLSFPSYYIDENAVVCLDGDGCKIQSGSGAIEEDSDIDTSIACDSCDKWYHAFCVGFDTEATCEGPWLCPRCSTDKGPQKPDRVSVLRNRYSNDSEVGGGDSPGQAYFSGRVSVSVADEGETAVVVSLVEGNLESKQSSESVLNCSKEMESISLSSSISNTPNSEALPGNRNNVESNSCGQHTELSLSQDKRYSSSCSVSPAQLEITADEAVKRSVNLLNSKTIASGSNLDLGLPTVSDLSVDVKENELAKDHVLGTTDPKNTKEDALPAENMVPANMETFSVEKTIPDENETRSRMAGAKRKHSGNKLYQRNADDGETEANIEAKVSRKKIKAERDGLVFSLKDQQNVFVLDDSSDVSRSSSSRDNCKSEKGNGTPSITDIIQGTDRRSLKQIGNSKERESANGLRLKKIMRRAGDDKDSLELVQELRKKIREAVHNKSSKEIGQNLFDPKLLDAFRAAVAGGAENRKPTLDVKAKKSLLQKGKVRESLTKKIYGTGGKRKRAWIRECEVEFWKHRCIKTSKPEKIQTLKSVLDVLRDDSDSRKKMPGKEDEAKGSILSRLYLADSSVFPRKNDIKPLSALNVVASPEQKRESGQSGKESTLMLIDQPERNLLSPNGLLLMNIPSLDSKEVKKSVTSVKAETTSDNANEKRHTKIAPSPALGGRKMTSEKDMENKSNAMKGDKRKWALELLARKTAEPGKNREEKEVDSAILKGNYTLLAQLPTEMRPVLAPSRHNKIPIAVREAQLYRLTEHFLKKANLSVVSRSAETELAVADAVNIEKQVADKSNSKPVYLNLCSQELRRRSDNTNSDRAKETNSCSTSYGASKETNNTDNKSTDLEVDEALRNAGLMSDSPPNSPTHTADSIDGGVASPDDIIGIDSHAELDMYGDFEYNLEDDDFIGAFALNISNVQPEEPPKIKLLFSSLQPEKPNGILDNDEQAAGSSDSLEPQNKTSTGDSTMDGNMNKGLIQNPTVDNDEELSLAECEELYGPEKEPLTAKYPETLSMIKPLEQSVSRELTGENRDVKSSEQSSKQENLIKEEKAAKSDAKKSEHNGAVMKKVEAYIKEHIRPLCKSGVITVDQYRWAVTKTTEKVMRYHSKEKNANFLIKEGEKVKKLAEQYVETAPQNAKT